MSLAKYVIHTKCMQFVYNVKKIITCYSTYRKQDFMSVAEIVLQSATEGSDCINYIVIS